jgi:transcription initiation factor TFIID subunit 1
MLAAAPADSRAREALSAVSAAQMDELQALERRVETAQFVYERMVRAPWNTTEAYVRSHLERDGSGKLQLTGVGDPSGRGEGFAFVRVHRLESQAKRTKEQLVHTEKYVC